MVVGRSAAELIVPRRDLDPFSFRSSRKARPAVTRLTAGRDTSSWRYFPRPSNKSIKLTRAKTAIPRMLIPRKPPKTPAKIESGSTITAAQATRLVRGAIISEPVTFPGCLLSPNRHRTPRFQIRVVTPTGVPTRFEQAAGYHPE